MTEEVAEAMKLDAEVTKVTEPTGTQIDKANTGRKEGEETAAVLNRANEGTNTAIRRLATTGP